MKKRIGKIGRGGLKVDIPEAAIDAAITGAEVVAGFMAAEGLSNAAKKAFPDKITTTGSALIKGTGAVAATIMAFTKTGRKYQKHLLAVAGGMGANAIATVVKTSLPVDLQALVPSVAGFTQLPGGSYRNLPGRSTGLKAA